MTLTDIVHKIKSSWDEFWDDTTPEEAQQLFEFNKIY